MVLKLPIFLPEDLIKVTVWNGAVHSRFGTEAKSVIQIHPEQPQLLVQFKFDANLYTFDDFNQGNTLTESGNEFNL